MKYLIRLLLCVSINSSYAQNINWSALNENQNNIVYLNFGYDFGVTTQVGYGYKAETFRPILFSADYSFPMGESLVDDFKVRLGGQISIYEYKNLIFSSKVFCVFRGHQTELVRMASLGSETSAIIGYYKPKWHIAGEFGYDKSSITHLKHSDTMKENFDSISDGWYSPSGGHFFYGIQGSKTIGKSIEISLRVGGINAQFKDKNPLLPFYTQLELNYKF